jgi:hypothetical protein
MFLIPWFAFCVILPRYAPVIFIAFLIIATGTMFVRPALFTFACLLAAVGRVLTAVLITQVTTENAEVALVAEPVLWTLRITTAIEPYPNAFVPVTIIAIVTVLIKYTFFAFACFLATVWCILCTVPVVSATFFADVNITIAVLRA